MKRILLILLMIGGIAYGQCPVVTGVTVTNLTSTTGKVSYTAAAGATLYYWTIYQVGSVTPAAGSTTTSTTFNFTGLTKSTSYKVYVRTQCGAVFSATSDSASFSTLSDGATYTPLAAQGYQMKYTKVDSGFNLPLHDTILLRGINQAGAQVYKPGSGVFVYNGSYWQGISGGSGTIIITDSTKGIDSITFNGYQECIYLHDSITPTCWQLNRFFDDVRLSDDSLWYKYYNAGTVVDSVPSGIKNVGAVWPLSYDGTDLTTSKPFNDSLYLSSLVLHGTSLYSKKLTGDSVFVGIMGAGGSTGIDSMYVTSDSLYQVFIYHSGRRDSVGYSGSSGSSLTYPNTTLKYVTGYGTFGSFRDTARAALSATGTGISYNSSTGVITGTALVSADTSFLHNKLVASFVRNVTRDSVILTLNDGTRYAVKDSSGGSGASTLAALTDVLLASLRNNQVLQYDSVAAKWKNQTGIQVSLSGLANNDILQYNSSNGYWENHVLSAGGSWSTTGNSGLTAPTNFLGTTDNVNLIFKRNGVISGMIDSSTLHKTVFGFNAGNGTTATGTDNTFIGYYSGVLNTSGTQNTGVGTNTLTKLTTGNNNVAVGTGALLNTTADNNVGLGSFALTAATSGGGNIAAGTLAAGATTTGTNNVAIGTQALYTNTTTSSNVAVGWQTNVAGGGNNTSIGYGSQQNSTGSNNTAVGRESGNGGSGSGNTAIGYQAKTGTTGTANLAIGTTVMSNLTTGSENSAIGTGALLNITAGNSNVALGHQAGQFKSSGLALLKLDSSILIGKASKTFGDSTVNEMVLAGYNGIGLGANSTMIGNAATVRATITGGLGINTGVVRTTTNAAPATAAQLDIRTTSKAFLPPRVDSTQRNAISFISEVESLTLTTGSGYTNGTYAISFSGGGGTGAAGTVTVAGNGYNSYTITNFGSGYTSAPTATISAGAGTGGAITVNLSNYEGATIFCTNCLATDGSTGVLQTKSSGQWRNHY